MSCQYNIQCIEETWIQLIISERRPPAIRLRTYRGLQALPRNYCSPSSADPLGRASLEVRRSYNRVTVCRKPQSSFAFPYLSTDSLLTYTISQSHLHLDLRTRSIRLRHLQTDKNPQTPLLRKSQVLYRKVPLRF